MHDDAFARMVAEEVRNRAPQGQVDYLNLPENWGRWQRALTALVANLDGQLAGIAEEAAATAADCEGRGDAGIRILADAQARFEDRRTRIERFRYHVENRLDEVTRKIALGPAAVDERLASVILLRRAIEEHRRLITSRGLEFDEVDEALWDVLDGTWAFGQEPAA
jgi:hypothetical protein